MQWGTGNIGLHALREVIRHPDLELVGVRVYDPAKDGVDAGALCGEADVGVAATTDAAAIHTLGADCVLHMPRTLELDDVVTLLGAGTNVVSTRGELFAGGNRLSAEDRARVTDACDRGDSSLYATGSSPGFITDALPHALLSLQRRVDAIQIDEYANLSRRDSPHLLFEQMGFGRPLDSYHPARAEYLLGEFGPPLAELAELAGLAVDSWRAAGEVAAARTDTTILAGEIKAGTIAGQRTTLAGVRNGVDVITMRPTWFCTADLEPAWTLRDTGWRVQVHGDAALDVEIGFPIPLEDFASFTPGLTAHRPVNAVTAVCAARPGILATSDLPPLTPMPPRRDG